MQVLRLYQGQCGANFATEKSSGVVPWPRLACIHKHVWCKIQGLLLLLLVTSIASVQVVGGKWLPRREQSEALALPLNTSFHRALANAVIQ